MRKMAKSHTSNGIELIDPFKITLSTFSHIFPAMGNQQSFPQPAPIERKPAVVLLGNSGAGKSTLLTQLGARTFKSGVRLRSGCTQEVQEEVVVLNGQSVILMDVPGLYESHEQATQRNAKALTNALSEKGYDYKLYFVTKADNRGPSNADLVMMSKINQCIKQVTGSRVSFRVIVNQIMGRDMYDMYQQEMAFDNFKSFFKALDTDEIELRGFSFAIEIDKVMLLRFSEGDVKNSRFKDVIAADVCECSQYEIEMEELKASNEDVSLFDAAVKASWLGVPLAIIGRVAATMLGGGAFAAATVNAGLALSAIGGAAWLLSKARQRTNRSNRTSTTEG
ncbi:MAG: hypothetical protein BYD32DRAFT_77398 [Podila humilis]|nr:MAG: hypothetical protein BYD32DRAFT_77398 [Podila humilis]